MEVGWPGGDIPGQLTVTMPLRVVRAHFKGLWTQMHRSGGQGCLRPRRTLSKRSQARGTLPTVTRPVRDVSSDHLCSYGPPQPALSEWREGKKRRNLSVSECRGQGRERWLRPRRGGDRERPRMAALWPLRWWSWAERWRPRTWPPPPSREVPQAQTGPREEGAGGQGDWSSL